MPPVIELDGLTKRYGKLLAVDRVSLRVEAGTVFGLLGPNGAGKSTLVKMTLSVVRPSEGSARLFGEHAGSSRSRRRVGFLPEAMRLPDFLNGRQFLRFMAGMSGLPRSVARERIPRLLAEAQLDGFPKLPLKDYSKGMQQRLGLAQALLHDPDVLFLDEPTEGLDPLGRKQFRDLLVALKTKGKTIFLNSHLLSEVEQICDRLVILNHGRIAREGSVADFTEVRGAWRLRVAEASRPAATTILGQASEANGFRIQARDTAELNACLDRLRAAGVQIEELVRERASLEDSFIEVVQS